MRTISVLPSLLTLCNFSSGFLSAVLCVQSTFWFKAGDLAKSSSYLEYACFVIFLGMVFDMMDGRVARMTNSQCQFGGELDSLADVCTFGVAPALILATMWTRVMPANAQWWSLAVVAGVVYAACAALRLAIYNLSMSDKPKNYFSGLPSPGAAGAVVGSMLFLNQDYVIHLWQNIYNSVLADTFLGQRDFKVLGIYLFSIYFIIVGLLMVSPFRFAHLTNLWFGKGKKLTFLVAVVVTAALLILRPNEMLFLGFNAFVLICLFINIRNKLANREHEIEKDMTEVLAFDEEEPAEGEKAEKDSALSSTEGPKA